MINKLWIWTTDWWSDVRAAWEIYKIRRRAGRYS